MTSGLKLVLVGLMSWCSMAASAQSAFIRGMVSDASGTPLPGASVLPDGFARLARTTGIDGSFEIELPANRNIAVQFSFVGFESVIRNVDLADNEIRTMNIRLRAGVSLGTSEVIADGSRAEPVRRIDPRVAVRIPSPRGSIEDLLLQAPVNFTSELSSGYNVRGGSFDENLVYVNDIEVYRPFLVRAGQQEGLSFPNPDMVEAITFSAGGFEAKYGDKLSSVLDIRYRKPTKSGTRLSASMLGVNWQQDAVSSSDLGQKHRWTMNAGLRYRDNSYVLGTLDDGGEYQPRYLDGQAFVTYDPDGFGPWDVELLGMVGANRYRFFPKTRQTDVGNINEALRLTINFDGQEQTSYTTGFGALSINHTTESTRWRFIGSAFRTQESEYFDVLGAYYLDELDRDLGSDELGSVLVNRGVGAFLNHARNRLNASVLSAAIKGSSTPGGSRHFFEWGVKGTHEDIRDVLSEWSLVDSAGYISPHPIDSIGYEDILDRPNQSIELNDIVRANNEVVSQRLQAYFQDTWSHEKSDGSRWDFNAGIRGHWWSWNQQLVGGPRARLAYTSPEDTLGQSTVWRLAGGVYYQPPFYREMRYLDGSVNPDIRAQQAIHAVLGMDRIFMMYGRPFKLVGELYYKDLNQLIPYEIENVRMRYYAENNSNGYATGLDVMLNGEFIEGVQSWMRASIMKTAEDLVDDGYWQPLNSNGEYIIQGFTLNNTPVDSVRIEPGFIPRQTDQRFNMSLLFQDEMPGDDRYKVLVSLFFGTGLPFGPPSFERHRDILRTPPYRRVDIGFSRELFESEKEESKRETTGFISLEIFNILGIRNTINHTWIEDVNGRLYAISNFLTDRRVNLKIGFSF